eukprot:TRINITY_DN11122_c0_g1_i1.p1 TRINITY_DN11122_c0_g1~~TRINITY_DN11122_c0_g1_i1.p1  ORF type:complete len:1921 (+),score=712.97 TRINITY_DN11122_c0_g1_i1:73-5835(+)
MGPSSCGIYIVESEISLVLMAMKRGNLWNSNTHQDTNTENLIKEFTTLKRSLNTVTDFNSLDTVEFLMPFLDVIRSEDVTGHVTGLALTSVNKFLSYDLIDCGKAGVKIAVENLADAVTHARFVGSDPSSDEVVLMKILDVLRVLILSKVGLLLTNESICEIMQSTLRICFEPRLSELLRKTAQHCLNDMVQLLFTRLPSFTQEQKPLLKKLKMRSTMDAKGKRKSRSRSKKSVSPSPSPKPKLVATQSEPALKHLEDHAKDVENTADNQPDPEPVTVPVSTPERESISLGDSGVSSVGDRASVCSPTANLKFSVGGEMLARSPMGSVQDLSIASDAENVTSDAEIEKKEIADTVDAVVEGIKELEVSQKTEAKLEKSESEVEINVTSPEGTTRQNTDNKPAEAEFTNEAGVTFECTADTLDNEGSLIPYGLPAVYELLRFLASLINPHETANTEAQINIGLSLITTALEVGVDSLSRFPSLLGLTQDSICRNLISLLGTERIGVFSSSLRCCFLIFSSLRPHLALQLEFFLVKLSELINSESARVSHEQRELSLELLVQLYKMPGFVTELYLNYDCGLYTDNLFEDLTKVLSKNAFPQDRNILTTHQLALEGLLVVLDGIEKHCQRRISDRVPQPPMFSPTKKVSPLPTSAGPQPSIMSKSSGHLFGKVASVPDHPLPPAISQAVPTHESLMAIKHKKKLITTGTDQFNVKPSKGIEYLQESRLLSKPTDPYEVAHWIRENPHLSKNQIGEYISNKKNLDIFKSFVKSFDFTNLRIDESLRMFLQTFRLPGEAPLISMIMEIFGEHWHQYAKAAGHGLADEDSPYTLAYAVIMLNTDQHNKNAHKNNVPMTQEQFIKNLRGTNGGGDHDPEVMGEIYQAIKNDEIIMPAEQTGLVKENYMWKQLLSRSMDEGDFLQMDNGMFDHNLFGLTWGPAVAALSYIYDKSSDPEVLRRALDGFSKCAMIAAHYAMSDVLDNLIISLTKFTMLVNTTETAENFKIMYGANNKALLATRAVFSLTHKYGDILREGWRNLTECLLQLFKCQLLPKTMMEGEDYIEAGGRVDLFREELPREKEDSGLINSLVSFIVASSEVPRELSQEEEDCVENARKTVAECHPEHLLQESKFLLTESLQELVKFLIAGSVLDHTDTRDVAVTSEHDALFYLELITRITIANRDRVGAIWRGVCDHLHRMISASARTLDTQFQLERAVTSLVRLGVRLARKEELASTVVQSLRILLAIKPGSILHVSKQVSYGLHELLRNNAANIHSKEDWNVIFTLLEVVGAGASPDISSGGADEDSGQGGTDDEKVGRERGGSGGWVDLGRDGGAVPGAGYSIVHTRQIVMHCSVSYLKCCETLSFLVRDVVHITPENFSSCVAAIRTFVEASYRGESQAAGVRKPSARSGVKKTPRNKAGSIRKARTEPRHGGGYEADESSDDELVGEYTHVTMQLLDLMHVLHTRAMGVQTAWERGTEELWDMAWCPVLQGMARLCCDSRASVRTQALTLLQRSLLVSDLQVLSPGQWEYAFLRVLFPMLRKLLEMGGTTGKPDQGREETKLRAAMMLSKVFLQHLGPLSSLPTFTALWLTILDLVGQFCATASTDILADALPESLKNMLLVMDTSGRGLFFTETGHPTPLWGVTWGKIDTFLPGLRVELFPDWEKKPEAAAKKAVEVSGTNNVEAVAAVQAVDMSVTDITAEASIEQVVHQEPLQDDQTTQEPVAITAYATEVIVPPADQPHPPPPTTPCPTAAAPYNALSAPAPVLGSLTTTAPPSSMFSNYFGSIISSQPVRARNPSLPDPTLTSSMPPPPTSPMEPPTLPFTAFSLPTTPSHAPSSLFSPITPAPPILTTPSAPVATPRPLLPTPQPGVATPSAPKHSNPLLPQLGDSTAFTTPLLPPLPQVVPSPQQPAEGQGQVDTV